MAKNQGAGRRTGSLGPSTAADQSAGPLWAPDPGPERFTTTRGHAVHATKIDCYDAIEIVATRDDAPSRLLAETARKVADLWNDSPFAWQTREVRDMFPELADALDELLGGGPLS